MVMEGAHETSALAEEGATRRVKWAQNGLAPSRVPDHISTMPIRHPSSDCCLASSRLALSMYIPHLDKITEIGSLQRSMTMHV